jgi:hypothetical protein
LQISDLLSRWYSLGNFAKKRLSDYVVVWGPQTHSLKLCQIVPVDALSIRPAQPHPLPCFCWFGSTLNHQQWLLMMQGAHSTLAYLLCTDMGRTKLFSLQGC